MTPDGRLFIVFTSGKKETILLSEIKGHNSEAFGFRIEYKDHRRIIPWTEISDLRIYFNSTKYQEWKRVHDGRTAPEKRDNGGPI